MRRSFKIVALVVGFVGVIAVTLPPWPQNVSSREPVDSEKAVYQFTLYCSRAYCGDLQEINAEQLDSISNAIAAMGPSGVEIKACEWTAFNCISAPQEEYRAVIRNLVETALVMQSDARTGNGGPTVGAADAEPEIRRGSADESTVVVPSGPRVAIGPPIH